MKKITCILLLAFTCICAQAQGKFTIEGHIENLEDGVIISLTKREGQLAKQIASTVVKNQRFSFVQKIGDEIEEYSIHSPSDGFSSSGLPIWAKAGMTVRVTGKDKYIRTWDVDSDIPMQREMAAFRNVSKDKWIEYDNNSTAQTALYYKFKDKGGDERLRAKAISDSLVMLNRTIMSEIRWDEINLLKKISSHRNKLKNVSIGSQVCQILQKE